MSIEIKKYPNGSIEQISINNQIIDNYGDEVYTVPKDLLNGIKFSEMPEIVSFDICEKIEENTVILSTMPFNISKVSNNKASVHFEDMGRRKLWDGDVGFKMYMETKRKVIEEREKEIGDIKLEDYDDDSDYIFLTFSAEIEASTFDEIINSAEQLIQEIEGTVKLIINSPFKNIEDVQNEKEFALSVFIPLLRKLGFSDVKYNHGSREFGKDITFSRKTEFDEFEFWGAQLKYGDVSGGVNSDIDTIISQIDDAFKVPFNNLYTKREEMISKVLIVVSGKYTDNAIEKICQKLENNAIKNNVIFIDREKIETLAEKFRK
jgi:hypothetical protein